MHIRATATMTTVTIQRAFKPKFFKKELVPTDTSVWIGAEEELFDGVVGVGKALKLANNDHLYFNGSDTSNL